MTHGTFIFPIIFLIMTKISFPFEIESAAAGSPGPDPSEIAPPFEIEVVIPGAQDPQEVAPEAKLLFSIMKG